MLAGTQAMDFQAGADDPGRDAGIGGVLKRFDYRGLDRADRCPVPAYLQRLSGYSRAQITRLVARWDAIKPLVKNYGGPRCPFARRYTPADVARLVDMGRAVGSLSGPATACVLRRQRDVFGDERFFRLGSISVGHLYNLRNGAGYRRQHVVLTKPPPTKNTKIEQMLAQCPFETVGFHADQGSEYINHKVAVMLSKLRIEFMRSRSRHAGDNGLAETKTGAVVRKEFGYEHIHRRHADRCDTDCCEYLNPFLNFHRPRLFATELADPKKPRARQGRVPPARRDDAAGQAACAVNAQQISVAPKDRFKCVMRRVLL